MQGANGIRFLQKTLTDQSEPKTYISRLEQFKNTNNTLLQFEGQYLESFLNSSLDREWRDPSHSRIFNTKLSADAIPKVLYY